MLESIQKVSAVSDLSVLKGAVFFFNAFHVANSQYM